MASPGQIRLEKRLVKIERFLGHILERLECLENGYVKVEPEALASGTYHDNCDKEAEDATEEQQGNQNPDGHGRQYESPDDGAKANRPDEQDGKGQANAEPEHPDEDGSSAPVVGEPAKGRGGRPRGSKNKQNR